MNGKRARRIGDMAFDAVIIGALGGLVVVPLAGLLAIPEFPGATVVRIGVVGAAISASAFGGQMLADGIQEQLF